MAFTECHILNDEKIIYQQYHPGDFKTDIICMIMYPQEIKGHFVFFNCNYWDGIFLCEKDDVITIMYINEGK